MKTSPCKLALLGATSAAWMLAAASSMLAAPVAAPRAPQERRLEAPDGERPDAADGGRFGEADGGDLRKSVALFFIHRARVELELSDEQVLKLLPLVEKVEDSRRASESGRGEVVRQLERLRQDPAARDEEVVRLIRELDLSELKMRQEHDRTRDEMLALLNPQQKAGFVLFANRFHGQLERKLMEMRGPGGPHPGPGRGGMRPGVPGGPGRPGGYGQHPEPPEGQPDPPPGEP